MLILEILVVLGAIYIGVRLGGIAIGFAGGLGVVVLSLGLGLTPGSIPWDVILIIASVIAAISAMQVAGGMDYLVQIAEKILRKNPKYINFLAPTVTYFLTIFAGTGHTAFSMIPVIVEVSKSANIKPSAPLSIAVVASQIAITASPISAAVVFMTGILEPLGLGYLSLLGIWLSTTFIACMLTALVVTLFFNLDLSKDPIYIDRLAKNLIQKTNIEHKEVTRNGKLSVLIFAIGVACVVLYATAISGNIKLIDPVVMPRDAAIMSFMLAVATFITFFCHVDTAKIATSSVFKSGMVACICVLGIAWLGDTFVKAHINEIKDIAGTVISQYPYMLAIGLALASALLYSQAATAKALIPAVILALGITAQNPDQLYVVVASFAAVSALFILPTYPTLLGAVQMDDTGTTKIGNYIFNHSFMIPGVLALTFSVGLGFILAPIMM